MPSRRSSSSRLGKRRSQRAALPRPPLSGVSIAPASVVTTASIVEGQTEWERPARA